MERFAKLTKELLYSVNSLPEKETKYHLLKLKPIDARKSLDSER